MFLKTCYGCGWYTLMAQSTCVTATEALHAMQLICGRMLQHSVHVKSMNLQARWQRLQLAHRAQIELNTTFCARLTIDFGSSPASQKMHTLHARARISSSIVYNLFHLCSCQAVWQFFAHALACTAACLSLAWLRLQNIVNAVTTRCWRIRDLICAARLHGPLQRAGNGTSHACCNLHLSILVAIALLGIAA